MENIIVASLAATISLATPLLIATLGEIFAERSGVMNLGIEGIMAMSAVSAFGTLLYTGNIWIAVMVGVLVGGITSLFFSVLTITILNNQILTGLVITLLGLGLSGTLGKPLVGVSLGSLGLKPWYIPWLSDIPYVGPILFQQNVITYMSFLLPPLLWVLLFKTGFGLKVRAVGEDPAVADSRGINVFFYRYLCVLIGGLSAGLAGAYLSTAYSFMWAEGLTAGQGWLAIILTIFSRRSPIKAMMGAYLFGGLFMFQSMIQGLGIASEIFAPEILRMTPYIFTLTVLVIVSRDAIKKRIKPPAGLYKPYIREERK